MKLPIYLDCNAATPVDDRVFEAMRPYFTEIFGNAASTGHAFGAQAREAVNDSRRAIAEALNVSPEEIVFTSGATESDNLAIKGTAKLRQGGHIITAATEHKAVLDPCRCLSQDGYRVTCLPVDRQGFINLDELSAAFSPDTILVSIMHGNNEIGTVQDIAAIGALCRARGVPFHTDATQTIGKLPFDAQALNVDMASLTAHKMYGPKGAGALYVRKDCKVAPVIDGGGHERGLRSGTLNVPGIVGLAKSLEVAVAQMDRDITHTRALRDRIWEALRAVSPSVVVNGPDPIADAIAACRTTCTSASAASRRMRSGRRCVRWRCRRVRPAPADRTSPRTCSRPSALPPTASSRCASASAAAPRPLTSTTWSTSCSPPSRGHSRRPRLATILAR